MRGTVLCTSCGECLVIPEEVDQPMACPVCGVPCESPPKETAGPSCPECGERLRATQGKPPHCRRCSATQIKPGVSPWGVSSVPMPSVLASGARDEDDDQPYRLPEDPEPKEPCPACEKPVPRGAVVCNHCGFDRQTRTKLQREHDEVDRRWEAGLRFRVRLGLFLAGQGLALAATIVVAVVDGGWLGLAISWLIGTALLAFVLGTYPRVDLTRSKRGKVRLAKVWRLGFIPLGAGVIRWREYEGVVVGQSRQIDFVDWLTVVFLFPMGMLPALLWWYFVINPDQFHVSLSRDHGYAALPLYCGRSDAVAKEIATAIRKVTGLP